MFHTVLMSWLYCLMALKECLTHVLRFPYFFAPDCAVVIAIRSESSCIMFYVLRFTYQSVPHCADVLAILSDKTKRMLHVCFTFYIFFCTRLCFYFFYLFTKSVVVKNIITEVKTLSPLLRAGPTSLLSTSWFGKLKS